ATGQNYDMFFFDKVWEDFGNNIIGYVIDKPTRNMLLKFKEASDAASDLGGCVSGSGDGC
ncbi:MAG TPA: hypothetical protein VI911_05845, partial [Patescibacteria group bacterium]|nr:hypothetical protein [Patescibacteria group bacterium]